MSNNRFGFHIRLNIQNQKKMQMLMDFYGKDYKEITLLALEQLYVATGQVAKKLSEQQPKEDVSLETSSQPDSQPAQ